MEQLRFSIENKLLSTKIHLSETRVQLNESNCINRHYIIELSEEVTNGYITWLSYCVKLLTGYYVE